MAKKAQIERIIQNVKQEEEMEKLHNSIKQGKERQKNIDYKLWGSLFTKEYFYNMSKEEQEQKLNSLCDDIPLNILQKFACDITEQIKKQSEIIGNAKDLNDYNAMQKAKENYDKGLIFEENAFKQKNISNETFDKAFSEAKKDILKSFATQFAKSQENGEIKLDWKEAYKKLSLTETYVDIYKKTLEKLGTFSEKEIEFLTKKVEESRNVETINKEELKLLRQLGSQVWDKVKAKKEESLFTFNFDKVKRAYLKELVNSEGMSWREAYKYVETHDMYSVFVEKALKECNCFSDKDIKRLIKCMGLDNINKGNIDFNAYEKILNNTIAQIKTKERNAVKEKETKLKNAVSDVVNKLIEIETIIQSKNYTIDQIKEFDLDFSNDFFKQLIESYTEQGKDVPDYIKEGQEILNRIYEEIEEQRREEEKRKQDTR